MSSASGLVGFCERLLLKVRQFASGPGTVLGIVNIFSASGLVGQMVVQINGRLPIYSL